MRRHRSIKKELVDDCLQQLGILLGSKIERDECGDPYIAAPNGTIHVDGHGFALAILLASARTWNVVKAKLLPFCTLRQDGDTAGVLHLGAMPMRKQASVLRRALGIRKKRVLSGNQVRSLSTNRFKPRDKQGVSGRKNDDLAADPMLGGSYNKDAKKQVEMTVSEIEEAAQRRARA